MKRLLAAALLLAAVPLAAQQSAAQQTPAAMRAEIATAYDVPAQLPALNTHIWSTFAPEPGVLADRLTYSTADGMLVPAILYRPDPKTHKHLPKLPAIVVVNGHGSDKFGWYAFWSGVMFARAGAVVLTYDPIGEGERNDRRASRENPSQHDAAPPAGISLDSWGRRLAGLMQVDLDGALRVVAARKEVDPARIGVVGYSMGAYLSGIAGARLQPYSPAHPDAPHFHALVLSGGGTYDDAPGYFDKNKNPCQGPPYRALETRLVTADGKPNRGVDLFLLNAMRGPTLVMNGTGDTVMDIAHHGSDWFADLRTRTLAAAKQYGVPESNVFTSIMYPGISHRTSWVNRDGVEWLNSQLHFAQWDTDAKIRDAGTTHISAWIAANHVDISPNYFREDREGGLDAVGQDIPALTRAQLSVLPEADWQRLKPQLTYDAWRAKVEQQLKDAQP